MSLVCLTVSKCMVRAEIDGNGAEIDGKKIEDAEGRVVEKKDAENKFTVTLESGKRNA